MGRSITARRIFNDLYGQASGTTVISTPAPDAPTKHPACTMRGLAADSATQKSGGLLVTLRTIHDFLAGCIRTGPALDLDPFALFKVLVVLKEMLNAGGFFSRQILGGTYGAIRRVQLVHRHGQYLGIATGLVVHLQHANGT